MPRSKQTLLDAILRSDFESFLRRCFMTLNPGCRSCRTGISKPSPISWNACAGAR